VDVYNTAGEKIASIHTPEAIANASFGGPSGTDLMLTASTSVFIISTKVRKMPSWPRTWANLSLFWLYPYGNAWAQLASFGPT
jgi:hypothetical protein